VLQSLLACPRHHLGGNFHLGVLGRNPTSEQEFDAGSDVGVDRPAGAESAAEDRTIGQEVRGYLFGLALAVGLTAASFWVRGTPLVYGPGLALALLVLAVAQMGIHLIFFLHITTAPDNENNVLALAFGILIVCLILFGSLWVMQHLNHNMVPMRELMQMQR
jgi:cytochrome o ubiquinol oxidase subunit IV